MTDQAKRATGRTAATGAATQMESMLAFNGAMVEAWMQANQAFAKAAVKLNEEMMSFANERMQSNADAFRALCSCGGWSDAAKVQGDWAQAFTKAYVGESGRLMEMTAKAANDCWGPLFERTEGVFGAKREEAAA